MRKKQLFQGILPYLLQEVLQAVLLFFALKKIGVGRAFKYAFLLLLGTGVALMLGIIVALVFKVGKIVVKAMFFAVVLTAKALAHTLQFLFLAK